MENQLECYRCGAPLAALSLPLRRLEECPACTAELHVCRMCLFYAPARPKACSEDDAEEVKNKQAANFCDYFKPAAGRHDTSFSAADSRAKSELDQLFGDPGTNSPGTKPDADVELEDAEALFKKD